MLLLQPFRVPEQRIRQPQHRQRRRRFGCCNRGRRGFLLRWRGGGRYRRSFPLSAGDDGGGSGGINAGPWRWAVHPRFNDKLVEDLLQVDGESFLDLRGGGMPVSGLRKPVRSGSIKIIGTQTPTVIGETTCSLCSSFSNHTYSTYTVNIFCKKLMNFDAAQSELF